MKKHYALYRDGLLLIRTKTYARAYKIQNEHMCLESSTGHAYAIHKEDTIVWADGQKDKLV